MTNLPTQVNSDLYNSVYNANEAIKQIYKLKNDEDSLRSEAAKLRITAREERARYKRHHFVFPLIFSVPLTLSPLMLAALFGGIAHEMGFTTLDKILEIFANSYFGNNGINFLLYILLNAALVCVFTFIIPCKDKRLVENAETKEALAQNNRNQINELIVKNSKDLSIIAPKYRYPTASEYIVELFELGRASTLPEAYDKLEEQLHRWRMEESMSSMISLQMTHLEFLGRIESNLEKIETNTFWDAIL